jgi:hypothetical protein
MRPGSLFTIGRFSGRSESAVEKSTYFLSNMDFLRNERKSLADAAANSASV